MPVNILNLPQYRVLRVEESDHDYHVIAEPADPIRTCPHCGSERIIRWGSAEQPRMVKDLPMHGKRVGIYVEAQRLKCHACSEQQDKVVTFSPSLPATAEGRWMTERLVQWISQQSLKRTFLSLPRKSVPTRRQSATSFVATWLSWRRSTRSPRRNGWVSMKFT